MLSRIKQIALLKSSVTEWNRWYGAQDETADLQEAKLDGVDLRGADLEWADLQEAKLEGADLRGANLKYALLHGADLRGVDLKETQLQNAFYSDGTVFLAGFDPDAAGMIEEKF